MPPDVSAEKISAEELLQALCPSLAEDILLSLRYHYYVKNRPAVPDRMYDSAEKEYFSRESTDEFTTQLNKPGSDKSENYSDRVRALTLYIAMCQVDRDKSLHPELL